METVSTHPEPDGPSRTPAAPVVTGLDLETTHAALGAGRFALGLFPGPIGELIDRELRGYVDSGHAAQPSALAPRLITVLAAARNHDSADPAPGPQRLPARYRKGSPLRWDYPAGPVRGTPGDRD
jgi:hypothetical protein